MIKECVVLNGKVINVGPWDYQITKVEVAPAVYDEEGNMTKEAVFEERTMNSMPEGTTIENRDFEYDQDKGWYEVGTSNPPTAEERLAALELAMLALMG